MGLFGKFLGATKNDAKVAKYEYKKAKLESKERKKETTKKWSLSKPLLSPSRSSPRIADTSSTSAQSLTRRNSRESLLALRSVSWSLGSLATSSSSSTSPSTTSLLVVDFLKFFILPSFAFKIIKKIWSNTSIEKQKKRYKNRNK